MEFEIKIQCKMQAEDLIHPSWTTFVPKKAPIPAKIGEILMQRLAEEGLEVYSLSVLPKTSESCKD